MLNYIKRAGRPTPQQEIEAFNKDGRRLELFAPTIRPARVVNGKVLYQERLLTYYYVFVKGTLGDVKTLCSSPYNDLSFLLDRVSSRRYGILSDSEMENFRIISRVYTDEIPFFDLSAIDLEEGDEVEVVGGPFSGLRGCYLPKSRSRKGNLVISAGSGVGAMVWDIDARYIRILKFSEKTRRPYDILDSFLEKLFPILRKHYRGESLSPAEMGHLTVFARRMGSVKLNNPKLEGKLMGVLMCVHRLLGDSLGYDCSSSRYSQLKPHITNAQTLALMSLLECVSSGELSALLSSYESLLASGIAASSSRRLLLDEYRHYLNL